MRLVELEDALDQKTAQLIQLQRLCIEGERAASVDQAELAIRGRPQLYADTLYASRSIGTAPVESITPRIKLRRSECAAG